jgi:hypothetical protein
MNEVLPRLVRCACHAGTRDFFPALAARVGPVQNIFSLTVHYFNSFVPITQQAGHAVVLRRLALNTCLWRPLPSYKIFSWDRQASVI